jgi:hypothetical protein
MLIDGSHHDRMLVDIQAIKARGRARGKSRHARSFPDKIGGVLRHMARADGTQTPIRAWRNHASQANESGRTAKQVVGLMALQCSPAGPDAMCPGTRRQFVVTRIACACTQGNLHANRLGSAGLASLLAQWLALVAPEGVHLAERLARNVSGGAPLDGDTHLRGRALLGWLGRWTSACSSAILTHRQSAQEVPAFQCWMEVL